MSILERILDAIIKQEGLPEPQTEFRFYGPRRWRMDMVWVDERLAVEIEGGIWIMGRHNRPKSMIAEMSKYNTAALLGYKVIRVTREHIESGQALLWIKQGLGLIPMD